MERVHTFRIFNIHVLYTDKTVWSLATVSTVNTAQSTFMSKSFKYVKLEVILNVYCAPRIVYWKGSLRPINCLCTKANEA